ncbi:MAG: low affinity iron permease family protein [Phenylobacterium sp.]|uniref:low affinity iron permease family protein n=1 Tax=Phenylobacterium sp. TaxID=1871053 RepID=UPI0039196401
MDLDRAFSNFASRIARLAGSAPAFAACVLVVVAWPATGPLFDFSESWQLVINTGTTIVTFLMVFLIQNTQNRDNLALQTKLDELILTSEAENEFIRYRAPDGSRTRATARPLRTGRGLEREVGAARPGGDVQPSTGSRRGARALNPLTPPQRP